jgi:hypothetical protein
MGADQPLSAADQILQDIGRKCAGDVSEAIHRNMALADDRRGKMIVAAYAAAAAFGSANGAFSAFMNGPEVIDEAFVDELWAQFVRPMVLGQFAKPNQPVNQLARQLTDADGNEAAGGAAFHDQSINHRNGRNHA